MKTVNHCQTLKISGGTSICLACGLIDPEPVVLNPNMYQPAAQRASQSAYAHSSVFI